MLLASQTTLLLLANASADPGTGTGPDQSTLIGWIVVGALALSSLALNLRTLFAGDKTQKREVSFSEDFVNGQRFQDFHDDIKSRLDKQDEQIASIWSTVREEDEASRNEMRKGFQDVERALGRIEGEILAHRQKQENS